LIEYRGDKFVENKVAESKLIENELIENEIAELKSDTVGCSKQLIITTNPN
jgi:hypothetical protein